MMDKPNEPDPPSGSTSSEAKLAALIARRRLLRGGLSVAPVLMAAAPRSVMAGAPGACVPASSFASMNASRPVLQFTCSGRTPGFWKQPDKFVEWPGGYVPNGVAPTMFDAKAGGAAYPGKTMVDVLSLPGNSVGRDAVARHIAAALLNAAKGWTPSPAFGESFIKSVWAQFIATGSGYYVPTAGIKWYADYSVPAGTGGIIPWLKSTMPV